jgi:uncharacterized protein (DUF2141 family)
MKYFKAMVLTMALTIPASAFSFVVRFENVRNEKGSIKYLVFKSEEGYPDDLKLSVKSGTIPTKETEDGIILKDLEAGSYSFSVIHDENNNDKLDTNFLGIPKEGFGFSNNPLVLFGPPSFSKTKVEVSKDTEIIIKMKYF